jgi:hypothetical protein
MTDASFHSNQDEDLPRTVRQQKEAARAKARDYRTATYAPSPSTSMDHDYRGSDYALPSSAPGDYPLTTVARLQVPFMHLVGFFLKAVLAAIPALLLLTLILWGFGQLAKHYMPWIIQTEILIKFPR